MKAASFHAIIEALEAAKVRYIVVDGLAVIAHGYLRATRVADIVLQLVPNNITAAFRALRDIGYLPSVPITAEQFSNASNRSRWREDKHMQVLQFWSDRFPDTKLDVFLEQPFDFDTEWQLATCAKAGPQAIEIRFASIPSLIDMKRIAGRPKDLIDIEFLQKIQNDRLP